MNDTSPWLGMVVDSMLTEGNVDAICVVVSI